MYCFKHNKTQTKITCARCTNPICIDCMNKAYIGFQCDKCSQTPVLPIYQLSMMRLFIAVFTTIITGSITGFITFFAIKTISEMIVWGIDFQEIAIYFLFLATICNSFIIRESLSRIVNNKQGNKLKIIALFGLAISVNIFILLSDTSMLIYSNGYFLLTLLFSGIIGIRKF